MQEHEHRHLVRARVEKNDEFYTRYEDIEKEVEHYLESNPEIFKNKIILCPCDEPSKSKVVRYFINNFKRLKIKELICSCIAEHPEAQVEFNEGYKEEELYGRVFRKTAEGEYTARLKGNGDFRSGEVTALRDEADIVITNPPFSVFREFIEWIGDKEFLIVASVMSLHFSEILEGIVKDKYHIGYENIYFCNTEKGKETKIGAIWLTTLEPAPQHPALRLTKRYKGNEERYPHYENYDAIVVEAVKEIPKDYDGVMGVPVRFLQHWNREQFEVLGLTTRENKSEVRTKEYTLSDSRECNNLNASGVVKTEDGYKIEFVKVLIRKRHGPAGDNTR